jgi:hypothetical protein
MLCQSRDNQFLQYKFHKNGHSRLEEMSMKTVGHTNPFVGRWTFLQPDYVSAIGPSLSLALDIGTHYLKNFA